MAENAGGRTTKRPHAPYIMPDGRPLGRFLLESNLLAPERHRRHGRRSPKVPSEGWSSAARPAAAPAAASASPSTESQQRTPAELAELAALQRVGQRRRRRWLNEKLLRDMSGPLSAKDMEACFKPAPFGDTGRVSAFAEAAAPEHAALIDLFRGPIDSDKQARVLLKWEQHVRELRLEVSGRRSAAAEAKMDDAAAEDGASAAATAAWARINSRARAALKKAPAALVEEIEAEVAAFGVAAAPGDEAELGCCDDGFTRLLGHGLASFYGLASGSRQIMQGGGGAEEKVVVLRAPRTGWIVPVEGAASCVDVLLALDAGNNKGAQVTMVVAAA
jgi:hypothetical protein